MGPLRPLQIEMRPANSIKFYRAPAATVHGIEEKEEKKIAVNNSMTPS